MKATTSLVALVVVGLLLQLNGFNTLGTEILNNLSPLSHDYSGIVIISAGSLFAFGMLVLGQTLPTRVLGTFLLGFLTLPLSIIKSTTMPTEIQVISGIMWIGLMIQAVVSALSGDV